MKNQQVSNEKESFLINNIVVNGNNEGSLLANKEYHICYVVMEHDFKNNHKKFFGCFINPNDLYLQTSVKDINDNIYFFLFYLELDKVFNISELLKHTLLSKTYSNHIVKKILKENKDITIKKIITKCEEELKKKY